MSQITLVAASHQPALDDLDQGQIDHDSERQEEEIKGWQRYESQRGCERREREQYADQHDQQRGNCQWAAWSAAKGIPPVRMTKSTSAYALAGQVCYPDIEMTPG